MGGFQIWHWIVIAVVGAILFFGWKQLPDMARSVGRSLRVFKTEIKGLNEDDKAREEARDEQSAHREVEQAPQAKQIAPAQRPVPQAQVVRNPSAGSTAAAEPARSRPRPTPSPNGRSAR
ncbi:Sec-independent protein translocase subunit TatA [Jatrophihabitans fulvus]